MPHWTLTLLNQDGHVLDTLNQNIDSHTLASVWVEGKTDVPGTWHFKPYFDETQARCDFICQFDFKAASLKMSTELSDTFIKPPTDPTCQVDSRVLLEFSLPPKITFAILRSGDVIEFDDQKVSVHLKLNPNDPSMEDDSKVEVTSSRPLVIDIKEESGSGVETDVEKDLDKPRRQAHTDESQHLYSTSRENQSPTQRTTTADSQVIKETPSRKRVRSQPESTIFDSINMPSLFSHTHPSAITQPELSIPEESPLEPLPDVSAATDDLPDTMQDSMANFLFSENTGDDGISSGVNAAVSQVVRNLNESQTPPQLPKFTLPKRPSERSFEEFNSSAPNVPVDPPTKSTAEQSANIQDGDHENKNGEDPDTIRVSSTPRSSAAKSVSNVTPASRSTGKRKRLRDVGSAKSGKRVKSNPEASHHGEDLAAATPMSTASRRSSSRIRSSRSASHDSPRHYSGPPPKILFSNSNVPKMSGLMRFLKSKKATETDSTTPKGSNFLCVGKGELKTTAKLLHSLTQGKTIVTDDWVLHSSKEKTLLDPVDFLPEALKGTMGQDRDQLFSGQIIYITPKLRQDYGKGFDDIQAIIRQAGGSNPLTGPLNKLKSPKDITIHLGAESDDPVATELHNSDVVIFKKELIGTSIVRGDLLVKDTDLILSPVATASAEPEKSEKPNRGRRKK